MRVGWREWVGAYAGALSAISSPARRKTDSSTAAAARRPHPVATCHQPASGSAVAAPKAREQRSHARDRMRRRQQRQRRENGWR